MNKEHLIKELINRAKKSAENAYCPYSGFRVGAAILTSTGKIFTGCNVEFSDYLALHAELNAIGSAVTQGERIFDILCVFSYSDPPVKPCGSCRQKIAEFTQIGKNDIMIIAVNNKGHIEKTWISDLLPESSIPVKKKEE